MSGFMVDGTWYPTDVPKQIEVFNDFHRYLLLEGCRFSGKSVGAQHKVYRHMVDCSWAKVALISRTKNNGKRGAWADLIGEIHETWKSAGLVEFIDDTPRMEGDTKMSFFRIRNSHGTVSECQLHSIDNDDEVEAKFKDTRFSMFYMIEADRFSEDVFSALSAQLRSLSVPYAQQQFILDTNPPDDGEDHWLYKRFFRPPTGTEEEVADWHKKYHRIHFELGDNPYLLEDQRKDLFAMYAHDPNKVLRYCHGKWVRDSSNGAFADVFFHNIHVVGEWDESKGEKDQELLRPAPKTYAIDVGMDIGDVNSAVVFGVPRMADALTLCYDIIDEVVVLEEKISIADITEMILGVIDLWEAYCKEQLGVEKILWRFWSDPSSMRHKSSTGTTEAQLFELYSKGRIQMQPVVKGEGSVRARLEMVRRMLFEERLFLSAKCVRTVEMFRSLRKSRSQVAVVDRQSKWKHAFDALSYMLSGALPEEIAGIGVQETKSRSVAVDLR